MLADSMAKFIFMYNILLFPKFTWNKQFIFCLYTYILRYKLIAIKQTNESLLFLKATVMADSIIYGSKEINTSLLSYCLTSVKLNL